MVKQHEITVKMGEVEIINRRLEGVDNLQTFTFFMDIFPFAIATNNRVNKPYNFLEETMWATTLFLDGKVIRWAFKATEGEMIDQIIRTGNKPVKEIKKEIKKEKNNEEI